MLSKSIALSAYYLNTRRLAVMLGIEQPAEVQVSLTQNSQGRVAGMNSFARFADHLLRSGHLPNLSGEDFQAHGVTTDRVLGCAWGDFTFSGMAAAIKNEERGKPYNNPAFSGAIQIGGKEFSARGEFHYEHLFSSSSRTMLIGRRRMLIAGLFQFNEDHVEIFPYIIGEAVQQTGYLPISLSASIRVYPTMIDAFQPAAGIRPTKVDIARIREMSEESVKHAIAGILGEPFIAKDWGGERSDLYTSRVFIDGKPVSAAFVLKGPSVKGTMHPNNMGKRGDQLIRAFDEPADLIVVQHCDEIATTVVKMAEAMAYNFARPRRYCIIDGADTAAILKSHGLLPQ